jgi:antirestriction protein
MLEEMGELEQVPQHLRYYIDEEAYGRDLLINDFSEFEGFVFRNC